MANTYDDGPSIYTDAILDILKEFNIKSTFFLVGKEVNTTAGRRITRRIYDEGHEIGVHTWSHPKLVELCDDDVRKEIQMTADVIYDVIGSHFTK